MPHASFRTAGIASVCLLVLATCSSPLLAAWPDDPLVNLRLTPPPPPGTYSQAAMVSDGAGGAIVCYVEFGSDVRAQRVAADGTVLWGPSGVLLGASAVEAPNPVITTDGAGGAIVAWRNSGDVYAQHVDAGGAVTWTPGGVALCTAPGEQGAPRIISDGAGGAVVTWVDRRPTDISAVDFEDAPTCCNIHCPGDPACNPPMNSWLLAKGFDITGSPAGYLFSSSISAGYGSIGRFIGFAEPNYLEADEGLSTGETLTINFTAGSPVTAGLRSRVAVELTVSPILANNNVSSTVTMKAFNAFSVEIASTTLSFTGITAGVQTPATIEITRGSADVMKVELTTTGPHATGGVYIESLDHDPPFLSADADIYAQAVSAAGTPTWTADGVALCTRPGDQLQPVLTTDGAGGAIVAWSDARLTTTDIDIYAQRVTAAGTVSWTADGVVLSAAPLPQDEKAIASDGAGGAIVVWGDHRAGLIVPDIYAQRVNATGGVLWAINGAMLCDEPAAQFDPVIQADGAGGAIVAWNDLRGGASNIFAQRVHPLGVALWAADGVPVCAAPVPGIVDTIAIVSDGSGGVICAWADDRRDPGVSSDVYGQRLSSMGVQQWAVDGAPIGYFINCSGSKSLPVLVEDGTGGALVAWSQGPTLGCPTFGFEGVYAQRIEHFGYLGSPEPDVLSIRDVPYDQGGTVVLEWTASYLDEDPLGLVTDYSVWRRVPSSAPSLAGEPAALRLGERLPAAPARGRLAAVLAAQTIYWEYVGSLPARGFPGYSYVAATTTDSSSSANPYTSFMVLAEAAGGIPYWASVADSGYSVDNVAPGSVPYFTAVYLPGASPVSGDRVDSGTPARGSKVVTGSTALHWGPSNDSDFMEYRLYRGSSADFVPGPGNLVVAQADTGYLDVGSGVNYYKLFAVDVHDNYSGAAVVTPQTTVGVPGAGVVEELWLGPAMPNPSGGPVAFSFALPRPATVRLVIYDPGGRRVRALLDGVVEAGTHSIGWDGRDDHGRAVASGIYPYRLEAEGRVLRGRAVRLQ